MIGYEKEVDVVRKFEVMNDELDDVEEVEVTFDNDEEDDIEQYVMNVGVTNAFELIEVRDVDDDEVDEGEVPHIDEWLDAMLIDWMDEEDEIDEYEIQVMVVVFDEVDDEDEGDI